MHRRMSVQLKILIFLAVMILISAVFSQYLCPYDPDEQNLAEAMQAPSFSHWMGTDQYGRDMLSRVIIGGEISILSTLILVLLCSAAGSAIGIVSGYHGGILDLIIMRVCDVFLAFPGMVLALAAAALFQNGITGAVLAIALASWPKYARIARGQVLAEKKKTYIGASMLAGDTSHQIIWRHILPNVSGVLIVTAVLDFGTMMMEIAGLSFLGLGAQPPAAEWGSMISNGRSFLATSPWIVLSPGIAIFFCVAVFNLLGDSLRDYLNTHSDAEKVVLEREKTV